MLLGAVGVDVEKLVIFYFPFGVAFVAKYADGILGSEDRVEKVEAFSCFFQLVFHELEELSEVFLGIFLLFGQSEFIGAQPLQIINRSLSILQLYIEITLEKFPKLVQKF